MRERLQRSMLLAFVLYLTFIGGTAYPDLVLIHRVFLQIAMTLSLGSWTVWLLWKRRGWPATPFDAGLGVYVVWLFVTTIFAYDTRVSLEAIWTMLIHVALFYLFVDLMQQGRQRAVFEALFLAGGVVVLVSVLEFASWYFGLRFAGFKENWLAIGGFDDPIPPLIHRVSLAFNISTVLANYVALLLPLVLGWAFSAAQKDHRQGLLLLFAGLGGVLVLTFSRGGWMAAAVGMGMFTVFQLRRSSRFSGWLRPTIFGPLVVGGLVLFSTFLVIFSASSNRSEGDQGRVDMWRSAVKITAAHPLVGVGVREFGVVFREYRDPEIAQDKLVAAHNLVLNTGAELGVPGVLILAWLCAVFLRTWWQEWQAASPGRRIRLEGILAALAGFSVHSLVDTFALTANVLPVLMMAAYVVAGYHSPASPAHVKAGIKPVLRWLPVPVLVLLVAYFVWFISVDLAYFQLLRSMQAIGKEDLSEALERIEHAHELDPYLKLYDLHRAYILGLLADEEPEKYLDQAIAAHLETLETNSTFDISHANLAGLYFQRGAYADAVTHLRRAAEIHPDTAEFHLHYGQALEELALQESRDPATIPEIQQAYHRALDENIWLAQSDFWNAAERYTGRVTALVTYYEQGTPGEQLFVAVSRGWNAQAAVAAARYNHATTFVDAEAQALYAFKVLHDYAAAVRWYTRAIELLDPENTAPYFAERAEAYWMMGNRTAAERDARTALFVNATEGARAYYILALLEQEKRDVPLGDEQVNEWLALAVRPRVLIQYYAGVVYARPGAFDFLPQLQPPGGPLAVYTPWLWLAERYAADDDDETDPQDIYDAIAERSPYLSLDIIQQE